MKIKKNKGFTLVELIVVLVILAILAAILVPALLGYVDKAKSEQLIVQGKNVMTAAQTIATEGYVSCKTSNRYYWGNWTLNEPGANGVEYGNVIRVAELADIPDNSVFFFTTKDSEVTWDSSTLGKHDAWTIYKVLYWEGDPKTTKQPTCAYFNGETWTTDVLVSDAYNEMVGSSEHDVWRCSKWNGNFNAANYTWQDTNWRGVMGMP